MARYDWKNVYSGEIVEHDHWSIPPEVHNDGCATASGSGHGLCDCWVRVFSVGIAKVEGGGGSKARPSTRRAS